MPNARIPGIPHAVTCKYLIYLQLDEPDYEKFPSENNKPGKDRGGCCSCYFYFSESEETVLPRGREIFLEQKSFDLFVIGDFEKRGSAFGVLTVDLGGFRGLATDIQDFRGNH